jgi:hypothetical protein
VEEPDGGSTVTGLDVFSERRLGAPLLETAITLLAVERGVVGALVGLGLVVA